MFVELLPVLLALGTISSQSEYRDDGLVDLHLNPPPVVTAQEWAEQCEPWDDWDKPAPPFHIHGTTYYVGTCGIASILITDDEGHILLDSGTAKGARVVAGNIAHARFDIKDIALLGYSHEHFDHVGGMAYLQELTGAMLVSLEGGAKVMESGVSDPADPQHGMHDPFTPAKVDFIHKDGDAMGVGSLLARSIATPGHTPGATTWQWESCEGSDCKTIVYADSLSPVSRDDYKFSDYPEYVAEYRAGLERLRGLQCDILLTPHPSSSKMIERIKNDSLVGSMSCVDYADSIEARLDARLAKEAADEE